MFTVRIARTGYQEYPTGREYRPPEEVFDPASIKSFEGAPVVVGHPAMIDMTNVHIAVGYVKDVHRDGDHLAATMIILDAATEAAIRRGDLVEISCGYTVTLDEGVQRNIRGNHIGLGPRGWGRCGATCEVSA